MKDLKPFSMAETIQAMQEAHRVALKERDDEIVNLKEKLAKALEERDSARGSLRIIRYRQERDSYMG